MGPLRCLLLCLSVTSILSHGIWYDNVKSTGCKLGYWGEKCQEKCDSERCIQQPHPLSPDDIGILCDKVTGATLECDKCAPRFFGVSCEEHCQESNCDTEQDYTCDKIDGSNLQCDNCLAGYTGKDCSLPVTCGPVIIPEGGKSNCSGTESAPYGTVCFFKCDPGYTIKGHESTTCLGNPPVEPVGFTGHPNLQDVSFLAGSKGWTSENLCLHLGYGSSRGGSKYDTKLADKIVALDGTIQKFETPKIVMFFTHIECAGVSPIKCMVPDLTSACVDQKSCLDIEHFLETCSECYSKQPDKYVQNERGDFIQLTGARKANCTTNNGDHAPSWYICDRLFDKWCAAFPESQYCERSRVGSFFAPNPCAGVDCSMRGTCNQHTGKCDCQWAYTGDNCENEVMTTSGHWARASPICEANACSSKKIRHQKDICIGLIGDVCIPKPDPGYICRGQLECMPDGAFRGEAVCTPHETCNNVRCHDHASCVNNVCECNRGFWGDGVERCAAWDTCPGGKVEILTPTATNNRICADINECQTANGGCEQVCSDLDGSFECACTEGWALNEDAKTCKRKTCEPLTILNGQEQCTGVFGDSCTPKCKSGFESVGKFVCEGSGLFIGDGRCRGEACEEFLIQNGDAERPCRGTADDKCIPRCAAGFTSQGYLTCHPPTFEGNARCVPNECPSLAVVNALEMCEGRTGEKCDNIRCQKGFYLRGSATCQADGTWSGLLVCDNIDECHANFGKGPCEQKCVDTYGGFECTCALGYQLAEDGKSCNPNACEPIEMPNWANKCAGVLGESCTPVAVPGYSCYGTLVCKRQIGSPTPVWEGSYHCNAIGCEKKYINGARAPCVGVTGQTCSPIPHKGYNCEGIDVCNGNTGLFEGNATCYGMKCGTENLLHGGVCNEAAVDEICNNFYCDNGYLPVGSLKCIWDESQQAGIWSGRGRCKAATACDPFNAESCGPNSTCHASGFFGGLCQCNEGFWGDGETCTPHSSSCAPGTRLLANTGTATQDVECVDIDECAMGSPCDVKHGVCMNTVGSFRCGCIAGYQLSSSDSTKCIPAECQPITLKGAHECAGKVGTVCDLPKLAVEGYKCTGNLTCKSTTLNFHGDAKCEPLACPELKVAHSINTCSGKEGDKCSLLCEFGYKETGILKCHNQKWSEASCVAMSIDHCRKFNFEISPNGTCADRDGVLGCLGSMTYQQAEEHCRGEGARLCSLFEVESGYVSASSPTSECAQFDKERIWTSTPCANGYQTRAASTVLTDYEHAKLECTSSEKLLAVKCCADEFPAPVINTCSPFFNYGDCEDACYNDITHPKGRVCACESPFHKLAADGVSCEVSCPPGMSPTAQGQDPFCVPHGDTKTFRYISFGGNVVSPIQVGKFPWGTVRSEDCIRIFFPTPFPASSVVQVQVTASRDEATRDSSARPFVVWVENVNSSSFRTCFHETGFHLANESISGVYLNWMAYTDIAPPAQAQEVALSQYADVYTQYTRVNMRPHLDNVDPDSLHVQVTINHRGGGVSDPLGIRGSALSHNAITSWVERADYHSFTVGVEETSENKKAWYHAQHANVDSLVFKSWPSMNAQGLYAGVVNMAQAQPMKPKQPILGFLNDAEHPGYAVAYQTGAREGLCSKVEFGKKFDAPPTVFVTLDHRADLRMMAHPDYHSTHNGAVAWVEGVTNRTMTVCYKDLSRYHQKHGSSVFVDWLAIV